jgi:hypothetical protein
MNTSPGPWKVIKRAGLYAIVANGQLMLCEGGQAYDADGIVRLEKGDWPLIAAAHEMLRSLQELIEANGAATDEELARAKAAVAKAIGA